MDIGILLYVRASLCVCVFEHSMCVCCCVVLHMCVYFTCVLYRMCTVSSSMNALCICCCLFLPVCVHECKSVALWPVDAVLCIDSVPGSLPVSHSVVSSSSQQQARSQPHSLLNYEMHISCLCCLYLIISHRF